MNEDFISIWGSKNNRGRRIHDSEYTDELSNLGGSISGRAWVVEDHVLNVCIQGDGGLRPVWTEFLKYVREFAALLVAAKMTGGRITELFATMKSLGGTAKTAHNPLDGKKLLDCYSGGRVVAAEEKIRDNMVGIMSDIDKALRIIDTMSTME